MNNTLWFARTGSLTSPLPPLTSPCLQLPPYLDYSLITTCSHPKRKESNCEVKSPICANIVALSWPERVKLQELGDVSGQSFRPLLSSRGLSIQVKILAPPISATLVALSWPARIKLEKAWHVQGRSVRPLFHSRALSIQPRIQTPLSIFPSRLQ